MKNAEYWAGRFKDLEEAEHRKGVKAVADIDQMYDRAIKDVESKIRVWYQRFADNNNITLAEAKKWLDKDALKELKWDIKEYIKYGKQNEVDQLWMKELENASAKVHISRLQALELQIRQSLEKVTADQLGETTGTMEDVYRTAYYHTAYEIDKSFGVGTDVGRIDQASIDRIINKPWAPDGKNFSDRIWENKNKLLSTIHQELTRGILTGVDPQKTIDAVAKKMNVSKHNAGRLVMTEEAYFSSLGQRDMFADLGVEKYEIVATLDSHTSEICQELDGQVFKLSEYEAGVTAPPFHVYCRSTTAPWFDDDFGIPGERVARDEDRNREYVPADMTYKEWADKYIKAAPIEGIREPIDVDFNTSVSGYKAVQNGFSIRDGVVTIDKRDSTPWDDLPSDTKNQLRYTSMKDKPFNLNKGEYKVERYAEGSPENTERDEIAKSIGADYLGFSLQFKNNEPFYIDFYKKGDDLIYSVGKADMKKGLDAAALDKVEKIVIEREKQIIENIGETNLNKIKLREGNEWARSMREFHRSIQADAKPTIISDDEYDAIGSPTLYRGIAKQSGLRTDIKSTSSVKEMADEFYTNESAFPSRGIYGDGVAYCSPAYKKIAWNYATNGGHNRHGGAIIEFKLKADARIIQYEDAVALFEELRRRGNSELLFATQHRTMHEVGKAMNALGYDAILKHDGDHTGEDFYVILNRGSLVTKENHIQLL